MSGKHRFSHLCQENMQESNNLIDNKNICVLKQIQHVCSRIRGDIRRVSLLGQKQRLLLTMPICQHKIQFWDIFLPLHFLWHL